MRAIVEWHGGLGVGGLLRHQGAVARREGGEVRDEGGGHLGRELEEDRDAEAQPGGVGGVVLVPRQPGPPREEAAPHLVRVRVRVSINPNPNPIPNPNPNPHLRLELEEGGEEAAQDLDLVGWGSGRSGEARWSGEGLGSGREG